jgi:hypothetical protein
MKWEPFPHAVKEGILDQEFFERLKADYPQDYGGRPYQLGRRNLTNGDKRFDRFILTSPAWAQFFDYINSQSYVEFLQDLFGDRLSGFGCDLQPGGWHWSDSHEPDWEYDESGKPKRLNRKYVRYFCDRVGLKSIEEGMRSLFNRNRKEELFPRFDIAEARNGYRSAVHADNPCRLAVLLIYFNSASEIEGEGGDLCLYAHREQKPHRDYERIPRDEDIIPLLDIPTKANTGVFLVATNNSYHGVTPLTCSSGCRQFAYIGLTSQHPRIWQ